MKVCTKGLFLSNILQVVGATVAEAKLFDCDGRRLIQAVRWTLSDDDQYLMIRSECH